MRISVVIISRNESARLRLALASYEKSVSSAWAHGIECEIVAVDDGSIDSTPSVVVDAAAVLPVRAIRNEPGVGIAEARNRGAAAAVGDILLFMDGDVLLDADAIVAHAHCHRERGRPSIVRGASAHLRCTRSFLDPETGRPFPGQEAVVARMGGERASRLVTADQVRNDFSAIEARASPGIYVGSVNADLYAAEIEALERDGRRDVCWMTVPGHNVSMPKADFTAVGGYDARQVPVEHRELGLRLCERGLDVAYAGRARSYHLTHQSRGRDPLNGPQDWMVAFYGNHPSSLAAKLMLIFWHSLARSKAVPEDARIGSILQLASILRQGSNYDYEQVFRDLFAAGTGHASPGFATLTAGLRAGGARAKRAQERDERR